MSKIDDAKEILQALGIPQRHRNDMCAMTFLALAGIRKRDKWTVAEDHYIGVHEIIEFMAEHYMEERYAENTRETIRKIALKPFCNAALVETNGRPTTSPKYAYRLTSEAVGLIREYGTEGWEARLQHFTERHESLEEIYAQKRMIDQIPVIINGEIDFLSSNPHNRLQKAVLDDYAGNFAKGSKVVYIGDTVDRELFMDHGLLNEIGISLSGNTILPDIILYIQEKRKVYFIEAVTSVGPVNPIRKRELAELLKNKDWEVIYVTAFLTVSAFKKFITDLAWGTEVWIAEVADHLIHLD